MIIFKRKYRLQHSIKNRPLLNEHVLLLKICCYCFLIFIPLDFRRTEINHSEARLFGQEGNGIFVAIYSKTMKLEKRSLFLLLFLTFKIDNFQNRYR